MFIERTSRVCAVKRKPKSERAIVASFVVACVAAVVSAFDLHGNHRYIVLAVEGVIILVAAIFIRRRVRQMKTDDGQALAE